MRRAFKAPPTRALWLSNALCWTLLIVLLAVRIQHVFFGTGAAALNFASLSTQTMARPPLPIVETRNPFDPGGTPWREAGTPAPTTAKGTEGPLRGIIILPGLKLAITENGAIKPGEPLGAGRLLSIGAQGAVLDTPGGPQPLPLPGSNRPTLQELNQAAPAAPAPAASKQGKL